MLSAAVKRNIPNRVLRGAALLDQFVPNWTKKVNVGALQMSQSETCILGQTFGDFDNGVQELAEIAIAKTLKDAGIKTAEENDLNRVEIDSAYYGFQVLEDNYDDENQEYDLLGVAWLAEVSRRRATAARRRAAAKGRRNRR